MSEFLWCGAMLTSYSALPAVVSSIEKTISLRLRSGFQSRHIKYGLSTEQYLQSIMDLNQRKIKMINIKVLVDRVAEALPPDDAVFLRLRYMEGKTFAEISERQNCSLRTAFRKNEKVVARCAEFFERADCGRKWFFDEYGNDTFFVAILHRLKKEEAAALAEKR